MTARLEPLRRLLAALGQLEKLLGALLIVNIVINIGAQVFSRYVLDRPLVWVEELATYSFIWATFLGASVGLKQARHIRIQTFSPRLTPARAAALAALTYLLILALLLTLLPLAWQVMAVEGRSRSISLPWPVPRSWFYSIPLFVGMASMSLTALYLMLIELAVSRGAPRPLPIMSSGASHARGEGA